MRWLIPTLAVTALVVLAVVLVGDTTLLSERSTGQGEQAEAAELLIGWAVLLVVLLAVIYALTRFVVWAARR